MKTFITHSPQETEELAGKLAALLSLGISSPSEGGMGWAKLPFTRGLWGPWHRRRRLQPHFLPSQRIPGENATLYHFDMFRVESTPTCTPPGSLITWITAASWPSSGAKTSPGPCPKAASKYPWNGWTTPPEKSP